MSDVVLVLGPVAFSDFEIPERIQFGGAQVSVLRDGGDWIAPDDVGVGVVWVAIGPGG